MRYRERRGKILRLANLTMDVIKNKVIERWVSARTFQRLKRDWRRERDAAALHRRHRRRICAAKAKAKAKAKTVAKAKPKAAAKTTVAAGVGTFKRKVEALVDAKNKKKRV